MDLLIDQVNQEKRTLLTQVRAASAAEALLSLMSLAGNRPGYVRAIRGVMCQRLLRRLCDRCKQPFQANPQAIAQMGGDPRQTTVLYRHYQLPPPEQRVDEDGKPVEMEPCPVCGGTGFMGRTAVFELALIDDVVRNVLKTDARPDPVAKVLRKQGNLTLVEQAYRAVLEGRTTINEVQRVLQKKS
jgi:type II secretory ATPase GspE/PulE/Tfp pilus assembly ATPase PilB-like protein